MAQRPGDDGAENLPTGAVNQYLQGAVAAVGHGHQVSCRFRRCFEHSPLYSLGRDQGRDAALETLGRNNYLHGRGPPPVACYIHFSRCLLKSGHSAGSRRPGGAQLPSKEELKQRVFDAIDDRADQLVNLAQAILKNPEPGFREVKTSQLVCNTFAEMGIPFRSGLGLTGVRADLLGGSPGPTMALLGELDSLIVNEHPHADSTTGAAHACGHHCQIGMLMGAAVGLNQPDVLSELSGRIALVAVPAEEYIEIEYRDSAARRQD